MINVKDPADKGNSVEEYLKAKGLQASQPGPKEKFKNAGGKGSGVLTPVVPKFTFKTPSIPRVDLSNTAENRVAGAEALRGYKSEVRIAMPDYVRAIRGIDALTDEDERTIEGPKRQQLVDAIAAMLNVDKDGYGWEYKEVAVLAYGDAVVKTCPEFRGSVENTLKVLVEVGLMEEAEGGVWIYSKNYQLAKEYKNNSEAKAIGGSLDNLVSRTIEAGKARFQQDLAAIKAAAGNNQLTVVDLKTDKEGRLLLETPDHSYRGRPYKGGILLLESSNGGQIRVLDGVGGCQRIARKLAEAGAFIWNTQLDSERIQLPEERLDDDVRTNMIVLHGMIYRGVAEVKKAEVADQRKAEFKAQTSVERESLKVLVTLTPVEFFLFGQVGTTLLDPLGRKPFEVRSQIKDHDPILVWDVVCLVERDEQDRIRVAECPERLNEFFAKNREFVPAGEKFTDVGWPLNVLLRMGFAAALAEATPEQKTEARELKQRAEATRKALEAEARIKTAAEAAGCSVEELSGISIPEATEGRV